MGHPGVGVCRSARRRDTHAYPRGGVHGRAELGEGLRAARGSFPCRRRRPARPWRRDPPGRGSGSRTALTMLPRWRRSWVPAGSPPWGIPWAAWSPSWCTGGTPRCCRVWCCAPPRATWGPRHSSWPPSRCRRWPPACGGTRFCSWSAPRPWDRRCWVPSTTRPPPDGPAPAAPDHAGQRRLGHSAVCEFSSDELDRPGRCPRRGGRHHPGPYRAASRQLQAGPGDPGRSAPPGGRRSRGVRHRAAGCSPSRCWRHAARSSLAAAACCARQPDAAWPVTMAVPWPGHDIAAAER